MEQKSFGKISPLVSRHSAQPPSTYLKFHDKQRVYKFSTLIFPWKWKMSTHSLEILKLYLLTSSTWRFTGILYSDRTDLGLEISWQRFTFNKGQKTLFSIPISLQWLTLPVLQPSSTSSEPVGNRVKRVFHYLCETLVSLYDVSPIIVCTF